jgi:phosphate transport system substrate-binding protein
MYKLSIAALILAACAGCSKRKDSGTGGSEPAGKATVPAGEKGAAPTGPIRVDGSSTVFLISQAVAEEFQKTGGGTVTVGESGTGGGFKKFCRSEIDVVDASRPIKQTEADDCKKAGIDFIELPIAYDGLAVVVHSKNTWVDHLTVEELKKMWAPESKMASWKDVRAGFPDKKLRLYGAGTDSGTYDYFTQAIVGKEHSSRGDYTASEDDNVLVQGVESDEGSLGFFGYAYYIANKDKMKLVPIDNGVKDDGEGPIAPSVESVTNGTYQPLSRPLFIYVSTAALRRPEVDRFMAFYLEKSAELSAEVGYIALPAKATELTTARYKARTTGSVFSGGSRIGVTVEKLLAAENK